MQPNLSFTPCASSLALLPVEPLLSPEEVREIYKIGEALMDLHDAVDNGFEYFEAEKHAASKHGIKVSDLRNAYDEDSRIENHPLMYL